MRAVKKLLEASWVVVVVPVITLFLSAIAFGLYGTYLAAEAAATAVATPDGRDPTVLAPRFFSVIDVYLLALVLTIFALGLYELFVGKLDVPAALTIGSVDELKAKVASVVILFVAIAYVKLLVDWRSPAETLMFGASTGILVVSLVLYYKAKEPH